jgi:hypothetical protein
MRVALLVRLFALSPALLAVGPASPALASGREPVPAPEGDDYLELQERTRERILKALPRIPEKRQLVFLGAIEVEREAKARIQAAEAGMGQVASARGLVDHAKGKWIGGADRGIAAAKEKLSKAKTPAEEQAARDELAHWEQNRRDGEQALRERQAALDAALEKQPELERELHAAREGLDAAREQLDEALMRLGLDRFLSRSSLDEDLARLQVLLEAGPASLTDFASRGRDEQRLLDDLLDDGDLLVQIAVADGAAEGNYGRALELYRDIQQRSPRARRGYLQRLALAVALEHAVPIAQRSAVGAANAPQFVDPVQRYLHFEQASLDGALDPVFPTLTVWDYRMVVNGEEPDEILTWGREMLRNYRPDHITTPDMRWRYVDAVRTEIRYGSQDNQYDRDDLQFFQNILMNGGVCGRRAFFGRFILRAFGIPTTARPQRGHAALAHWTPEGWVVCLGGGWGSGWTKTRYDRDRDFLATTQARATGERFLSIKRAHWIADAVGEQRVFGLERGEPGFWNAVALYTQRALIADAETLAAVGEDIAEANETSEPIQIVQVELEQADLEVSVDPAGVITLPAAATSRPTRSTGKIRFMDSALGGKQLHYGRNGRHEEFEYAFDAPTAGTYDVVARVVTPSWRQSLLVSVNGQPKPVEWPLPFTVGMWESTEALRVELEAGRNTLRFTRTGDVKGVTIKDFTLTPRRR